MSQIMITGGNRGRVTMSKKALVRMIKHALACGFDHALDEVSAQGTVQLPDNPYRDNPSHND